ncbi:hypothetical protein Kyoto55A_12480 [Helicobacter pylori]
MKENKEIKDTLADKNIRVIIGNPPYSAGAKSQNDNNQNLSHPKLEERVYEKYGKNSTAKVGATTRDTLIQSIYMASKLLKDKESGEMHTSVEYKTLMNAEEKGYYNVETMKKIGDRINYNNHITITKIPKKAFDYALNGKSAIDWVIERYKKTTNKDSLIENNPNDYAGGKYVFELLCRVIKLSEKSVDLIEKISEKRFE